MPSTPESRQSPLKIRVHLCLSVVSNESLAQSSLKGGYCFPALKKQLIRIELRPPLHEPCDGERTPLPAFWRWPTLSPSEEFQFLLQNFGLKPAFSPPNGFGTPENQSQLLYFKAQATKIPAKPAFLNKISGFSKMEK